MKKRILTGSLAAAFAIAAFGGAALADPSGDLALNQADPQNANGNCIAYYSSLYTHNGGDFGSGNPAHGNRGAEIKWLQTFTCVAP